MPFADEPSYQELEAYLNDVKNGYRWTVAPYAGGLGVAVYMGK